MRRKISLFIDGNLADLDAQSFILFNYTMDDLSNPTIVKNSFSQQITLPGTPNNNAIFGEAFRLGRKVDFNSGASGAGFNPSKKMDFAIYNELGEILESGYCKLDNIVRSGVNVTYKVSLFGGLGSFFYNLSYADDGRKLTLADLDYLGNGDPGELDFTINATTLRTAWDDLYTYYYGGDPGSIWKIINFAPAYNGYPENFSPDKAVVVPGNVGLPSSDGAYTTTSGYALVNLANKVDEWAVKDLRSYLQRPILNFKAFLDAISNPDNNGGYSVDHSNLGMEGVFAEGCWITLPTIPSLGSMKQSVGTLTLTMSTTATPNNDIGRWDITGDTIPYGAIVSANIKCRIRMNTPAGADSYSTLSLRGSNGTGSAKSSVLIMQMVAYASDNTIVGGSSIKVTEADPKGVATSVNFTPPFATDNYERVDVGNANKVSSGIFAFANEVSFQVECQDAAYYKLFVFAYQGTGVLRRGRWEYDYSGNGATSTPTLYATYSTYFTANSSYVVAGSGSSVSMTDPASLRSNARITKQMLLSTSGTPAEYLLSFCKIFGLYFITDTAQKKITIVTRNGLYIDETIDLTERVALSKDIEIDPLVFDSKWYRFSLEGVGGAFFNEYKDVEGIDYGIQMVDTGFDFDADVRDLLDGNVFKNAATILQSSRYWNVIKNGATFIPSPFVDTGNTYSLRNPSGDSKEYNISVPPSTATISYYNTDYNGYDKKFNYKVEFAEKDGKPIDGKDVLLILSGFSTYNSFKITDDLPVMSVLNGGTPCWILDEGAGEQIPSFSRYKIIYDNLLLVYRMMESLDFGVPRQLDIPGLVYDADITIYARAWQNYLTDRYDVDTQVMRCKVDFRGVAVNQELLRKFYYYDGCLWVLNKIINYSLTTFDPVECEFIRVQDKANYLTGQTY